MVQILVILWRLRLQEGNFVVKGNNEFADGAAAMIEAQRILEARKGLADGAIGAMRRYIAFEENDNERQGFLINLMRES